MAFNSSLWMGCDVIFIFVYFGGKITKKKQDTDREIRNGERKSTFILKTAQMWNKNARFGRFFMVSVDELE